MQPTGQGFSVSIVVGVYAKGDLVRYPVEPNRARDYFFGTPKST